MSEKFELKSKENSEVLVYEIKEEMELLPFLRKALFSRSRNSVKSILARGQVKVDHYIVTQFNYRLYEGQTVEIVTNQAAIRKNKLIGLSILHEDKEIIVVEKDAGLLSIASEKEKEYTAHKQLMDYVTDKKKANRIYIVHRLDKDTSGIMIFAKSEKTKYLLQKNWREMAKERSYVALVEGEVTKETGKVESWLNESKTKTVFSSFKPGDGLHAVTYYKKRKTNEAYTLLDVQLETGRKNQIRVHMQDMNHPVVGDKKYGSTKNAIRRLGLHARKLTFIHPTTREEMTFESKIPTSFLQLIKKK